MRSGSGMGSPFLNASWRSLQIAKVSGIRVRFIASQREGGHGTFEARKASRLSRKSIIQDFTRCQELMRFRLQKISWQLCRWQHALSLIHEKMRNGGVHVSFIVKNGMFWNTLFPQPELHVSTTLGRKTYKGAGKGAVPEGPLGNSQLTAYFL
jgi:hypothetical protein